MNRWGTVMSLLALFQWCEQSHIGDLIRRSPWLFPAIEAIHLLGLGFIGGAVLMVDLRLLGFGLRRQSAAQLSRDAQPWLVGSLIVMIITEACCLHRRRSSVITTAPSGSRWRRCFWRSSLPLPCSAKR